MADDKSVKNEVQFKDDEYIVLGDDFKEIQTCTGMYLGGVGNEGVLHMVKEIFTNALDECNNTESPANKITVIYNENTAEVVIDDNGRGIPFSEFRKACTKKHVSTKFMREGDRSNNIYSAGMNGVGIKVVAALSDYYITTSCRGKEEKTIEFINGEIKDHEPVKCKKNTHGLITKFKPSRKYLGEFDLSSDDIENYLRGISYIMPKGIKIKYIGMLKDSDVCVNKVFTYSGLEANVEYLSSTLEFPPIFVENIIDDINLEVAFSYDKTLDDTIIDSYCNFINTKSGGYHEIGAQRAICDFFSREAKKADPNHKHEVLYDDCKKGLILAVNCKMPEPLLEGQHKDKLGSKEVQYTAKKIVSEKLIEYFSSNNGLLKKIISYLRQISKARLETHKIKGIDTKKPTSFLDDAELRGFTNISNRNYKGYKELLITEGVSAGGSLEQARNAKHQAIYTVTGVVSNTMGEKTSTVMGGVIFRTLVKILGCGIGPDFDINKLKWNKIIICTDADRQICPL